MKYTVVQFQMVSPLLISEFFELNYIAWGAGRRKRKTEQERWERGRGEEGKRKRKRAVGETSWRTWFCPRVLSTSRCPSLMGRIREMCVCSLLSLAQFSCNLHSISIRTCSADMFILRNMLSLQKQTNKLL